MLTPNLDVTDVITGRSTVPGLSSHMRIHFETHDDLDVPIQLWVDESLKTGMSVNRELMHLLENKALESEAMEVAFRFLRVKPRTELEVRKRLLKAEVSEQICEQVIQDLIARGFVNDVDYTERFISAHGSRMSRRELTYRLSQKGIETSIAAEQLDSEAFEDQERYAAERLARKHWRRNHQRDRDDRRKKLANYLQMKGFRMSTIYEILHLMEAESQESEHS